MTRSASPIEPFSSTLVVKGHVNQLSVQYRNLKE